MIQRRLDFLLISNIFQDEVEEVKIIPSIKSDHSPITLLAFSMELKNRHGPSHWKFDSNLIKDKEYIKLIRTVSGFGLRSFKDASDKRVLWDTESDKSL